MLNIIPEDFIILLNGVAARIVADGVSTPQCFDVAQLWARVIGSTPFTGATADLIYNQPGSMYTQVPNSANNFPVKGDLVIWSWPHVALATGNNTNSNSFEVLEQNDPTGSECHIKTYNYNGVIGWLHPNQLPENQQAIIDQLRQKRDDDWNKFQADESTIANLNNLTKQKDNDIAQLNSKVSTLESQATALQASIDSLTPLAKQVPILADQFAQAENDLRLARDSNVVAQKSIAQYKAMLDAARPKTLIDKLKFLFS